MRIEGKKNTILFLQKNNIKIVKIHGTRANEELTIPFQQISSIEVKKPERFRKGYIQFKTTSIMQRFIWFTGEENYNTAIKIQKSIIEHKNDISKPNPPADNPKPEITVKIPETIGEFKLEYKYENVEILLSSSVDKQLLGEFIDIVIDGEDVLVLAKGKELGHIISENLSEMVIDFNRRSEPVSGILSSFDSNKAYMFLLFYKLPKYKRLLQKGASHKEFKLIGTNNAEFQSNISLCSTGEEVAFTFDYDKEIYLASCGMDIGFFPKEANNLLDSAPNVFINSIDEDIEGKVSVIVSVFK